MKSLLNFSFLLAFVSLALAGPLAGQTYENSRSVREAYRIAPSAEVQVINKYGDIHLIPWEKDSVVFEIQLSVSSTKQAKVDKIFDYIDFDFKATAYYVIAQTVFEGQDNIWSEMADVAGTIFSSGTTTSIDYTVYFPLNNDIRIENKFGNIYTTDHFGKADINLSNGDLKAHHFSGPAKIKIEFGNASIDRVDNGTITLGYAELNIDHAEAMTFESRSSKIYINTGNMLQLNSRRDRFYIKTAGDITGETFFSYLNADLVNNRINLKTSYGDVKILGIAENFQRMDFSSQYSDINIYHDDQHLLDFDITRDDKSQIIAGTSLLSQKEEPVAGVEKTFRSSIQAGKADKPRVPVLINIKSGKLYIL